jgi:hypothetical protein
MLGKRAMWVLLAAVAMGSAAADQTAVRGAEPDSAWAPAAKRDNGLGALPHYREWREPWLYAFPAEKVDSGLGSLPPLSEWRDPWLYATPAEKVDSGLGSLPPLSAWQEPWLYAIPADGRVDDHRKPPARSAPAVGVTALHPPGG